MRRKKIISLGFAVSLSMFMTLKQTPLFADVVLAGFENTLDTIIPGMPFHKDLTPDPPDSTGPDILDTNFVCGGPEIGVTQGNCALEINHPPDWGTDEFYLILSDQGSGNAGELQLLDLMAQSTAIQFDVTTFGAHNPQYRQIFMVLNTNYLNLGFYDANPDPDVQLDYDVAAAEDAFFTTTVTLDLTAALNEGGATDGKVFHQALAQLAKADNEDGTPVDPALTWQLFMVFQGADDPFVNPVQIVLDNFRLIGATNPSTPGDFDNDGDIDGNDFLIWQRGNSPTAPLSPTDLTDWQAGYGAPLSTIASVPEPSTGILLLGGMLILLKRRIAL